MKRVPNALTVARMLVTPVLIVCLFQDTLVGQGAALALLAAAALSDYLDGRLARTLEAQSRLGRFLDPLADKVLVLGTFSALAILWPAHVPWWTVVLIALRDVFVTALRMRAEAQGQSLKTLPMAKWKTSLQLAFLIGLVGLLFMRHMNGALGEFAGRVLAGAVPVLLLSAVVAITVATGLWYVIRTESITTSG